MSLNQHGVWRGVEWAGPCVESSSESQAGLQQSAPGLGANRSVGASRIGSQLTGVTAAQGKETITEVFVWTSAFRHVLATTLGTD